MVFVGFAKTPHPEYTFDSTPELLFAGILESDPAVAKWLRPAPNQFDIYWDHQTRKYQPDFVAETADRCAYLLLETDTYTRNLVVLEYRCMCIKLAIIILRFLQKFSNSKTTFH